jgi:hypothetical protein
VSVSTCITKKGYDTKSGIPWFAKKETNPGVLELHFLRYQRGMAGPPPWETDLVLPYPVFNKLNKTEMEKMQHRN